jgi:hypothetical protein
LEPVDPASGVEPLEASGAFFPELPLEELFPDVLDGPSSFDPVDAAGSSVGSVGSDDETTSFDGGGELAVPPYGPPSGGSVTAPQPATTATKNIVRKMIEECMLVFALFASRRTFVAGLRRSSGFMRVSVVESSQNPY